MAAHVSVSLTALAPAGLTLVLFCLRLFVRSGVLVWTVALMFDPRHARPPDCG